MSCDTTIHIYICGADIWFRHDDREGSRHAVAQSLSAEEPSEQEDEASIDWGRSQEYRTPSVLASSRVKSKHKQQTTKRKPIERAASACGFVINRSRFRRAFRLIGCDRRILAVPARR
jgi:hypothetical protein